jgi:endo-1,4-beta-xylanase
VTTDGGVYDLYRIRRNPPPSINGSPWYQYRSVRQSRRTSGRITLANHYDAWARAGMPPGAHDSTILATEAYQSPGGSSRVTVHSAPAPAPAQGSPARIGSSAR